MKITLHLLLLTLLFACQSTEQTAGVSSPDIDTTQIAKHVEVLASDDFQGRMPFTEGETKTINYLREQFKSYGLAPGNGDSYFQSVPLIELEAQPSETMTITSGDQEVSLQSYSDFVAISERGEEVNELKDSELIFAGFGVVAPEYGWNDYEGLDVEGKTVIVLVNDPGFGTGDSTLFKGNTMTYYGRWTYKYEEAARQGAAGVIIIHDTAPASYGWSVVRNGWSGSRLYLDQSADGYKPVVQGWITRDAAIKIFEASPVDMKNFVERSREKGFKAIPLEAQLSVTVNNKVIKNESQNVIAKIEGTERPDETIIYTAHWDHLGIGTAVDGDSIYNGAEDNASGTATLLEIARSFSNSEKPKRTVVFLIVTAEEKGLLGSMYYTENPIYPPEKTVASINMDALHHFGAMKDLTIIGSGQSELEEMAAKIAEAQGRVAMPDPHPDWGYYFRSDHFQFAKIGIPAFYGYGAQVSLKYGAEYAEQKVLEHNANTYHQPSDEYVPDEWLFGGIYQDAELFYELGWQLANSDQWPKWKEGSEFKSIREGN